MWTTRHLCQLLSSPGLMMMVATGWEATPLSRVTGEMQPGVVEVVAGVAEGVAAAQAAAEARVGKADPRAILRCMVESTAENLDRLLIC